jgi:hypothetical protein
MTKRPGTALAAAFAFGILFSTAGAAIAQEDSAETPKPPPRPPEGQRIINLPSADTPPAGTLALIFTHRFSQPVEESDWHDLWSFDSGAEIGIGLSYTPIENLDVGAYRSSHLDVYELDAKYRLLKGPLALAVRGGWDHRSERDLENRDTFFAQAIIAFSFLDRFRVTAVPTYVNKTAFESFVSLKPVYEDIFSVPVAVSIAITKTINVQGEVVYRVGKADSTGVGWIAAVEKTLLRHRFAFTVGNQRGTTVDQYVSWQPAFFGQSPHRYYLGFNLVRQWKL